MKKNLLSGLAILLPLAVTIFIFVFLVDLLTAPFLEQMKELIRFSGENYVDFEKHKTTLIVLSRAIILLILFLTILLLGFLGKVIFFHYLMKLIHRWMMKIPLINRVYNGIRDIVLALLSEDGNLFKRVVAVPFPSEHSKSIGLVTGNAPVLLNVLEGTKEIPGENKLKTVFVATSPHPLSGFLLLTEEKYLTRVDFTVEDAFKYLLSCGVYTPGMNDK